MKAGTAQREITLPDYLIGDASVHDPLFASALVLDDGATKLAIICIDLVYPTFPGAHELLRAQGIDHVFINASHTHSDGRGRRTDGWRERVDALIAEAVEAALSQLVAVSLHAGRQAVQIGYNRYARRFTEAVIPWVNTLEVRTESDGPLAILFEHAAHPVMTVDGEGG